MFTSGRNAIILVEEPALRVVLMVLGKGATISEHEAPGGASQWATAPGVCWTRVDYREVVVALRQPGATLGWC